MRSTGKHIVPLERVQISLHDRVMSLCIVYDCYTPPSAECVNPPAPVGAGVENEVMSASSTPGASAEQLTGSGAATPSSSESAVVINVQLMIERRSLERNVTEVWVIKRRCELKLYEREDMGGVK